MNHEMKDGLGLNEKTRLFGLDHLHIEACRLLGGRRA
jgi:hypothetical protein